MKIPRHAKFGMASESGSAKACRYKSQFGTDEKRVKAQAEDRAALEVPASLNMLNEDPESF